MADAVPARLLDITRLLSRAGRGHTGVDRVERAYLAHLAGLDHPLFLLARTSLGYLLLDHGSASEVLARVDADEWGPRDALSWLAPRRSAGRARAEATLRRLALARCRPRGLGRMLRTHLPAGTAYLNTGHSNLSARVLGGVRQVPGARVSVLIHDTIPLDHPGYQRPGTPEKFAAMLARVMAHADLVICNSACTRDDIRRHAAHAPPMIVAHLGVTPAQADPAALPRDLPPPGPYFVALGTIEPRKNHALLLDVWDDMAGDLPAADLPTLVICGRRGWNNAAVFRRLDAGPLRGGAIREHAGLSDGAIAALLQGSAGLLFPSHAEGFGLPPLEAAAMGLPVVSHDMAVIRETLGDIPVYPEALETYPWRTRIALLAAEQDRRQQGTGAARIPFVPPDWQAHFNIVLKAT